MKSRVIWCLGMYASASTWMLNAVREIQVACRPGERVAVQFVRDNIDSNVLAQQTVINIVKSHEIPEAASLLTLAGRADTILMTVRDPRDAVASMMEYQKTEFDKATQLVNESSALCLDFLKDRRTTCFHYESEFFAHRKTLFDLALIMGCTLSDGAAEGCFERLSRPAVERLIKELPRRQDILYDPVSGDFLDPQTQWHTHHAGRSGRVGRWRQTLSEAQARDVLSRSDAQRVSRLTLANTVGVKRS